MDKIKINKGLEYFLLAYFDDLLVYSKTIDLNEQHLQWTFECLHSKKLYTGRAKCIFGQTWVEYLGHIVGGGIVVVDPAKTHSIMDWPEPIYIKHF